MRESRNGLRPIIVQLHNGELKGYFHGFSQEGNLEKGIGTYVIIELEDGTVRQVDAFKLKFEDVE